MFGFVKKFFYSEEKDKKIISDFLDNILKNIETQKYELVFNTNLSDRNKKKIFNLIYFKKNQNFKNSFENLFNFHSNNNFQLLNQKDFDNLKIIALNLKKRINGENFAKNIEDLIFKNFNLLDNLSIYGLGVLAKLQYNRNVHLKSIINSLNLIKNDLNKLDFQIDLRNEIKVFDLILNHFNNFPNFRFEKTFEKFQIFIPILKIKIFLNVLDNRRDEILNLNFFFSKVFESIFKNKNNDKILQKEYLKKLEENYKILIEKFKVSDRNSFLLNRNSLYKTLNDIEMSLIDEIKLAFSKVDDSHYNNIFDNKLDNIVFLIQNSFKAKLEGIMDLEKNNFDYDIFNSVIKNNFEDLYKINPNSEFLKLFVNKFRNFEQEEVKLKNYELDRYLKDFEILMDSLLIGVKLEILCEYVRRNKVSFNDFYLNYKQVLETYKNLKYLKLVPDLTKIMKIYFSETNNILKECHKNKNWDMDYQKVLLRKLLTIKDDFYNLIPKN